MLMADARDRVVSFMVREAFKSRSIAPESGVARSVKFQPGLDRSYHKRMRIKIGPSACIDCRIENSQTFLWGPPDTGPLARDFLQEETREANLLAFRGSGITWKKASSNRTLALGRSSRWTGKSCVHRTCRTACRIGRATSDSWRRSS